MDDQKPSRALRFIKGIVGFIIALALFGLVARYRMAKSQDATRRVARAPGLGL